MARKPGVRGRLMKLFREWSATLDPPFEPHVTVAPRSCYCGVRRQNPTSGLWHFLALLFRPNGASHGEQCWLDIGIGPEDTLPTGTETLWHPDDPAPKAGFTLRPHGLWSESRFHCGWIIRVEEKPLVFPDHVSEKDREAVLLALTPPPVDECYPPADREGIFDTPEAAMEHLRGRMVEWVLPYMAEKENCLL